MYKIFKLIPILLAAIVCGCSDDPMGNNNDPVKEVTKSINGKVEKGPMVRGTQIELRTLDASLNPNGRSYTASIEDNAGTFDFGTLNLETQYAKLTADGYFFNEVDGNLSDSPIKLDAIVDLTQNNMVNVNILTHLKSQRILRLVSNEGKSLKEANSIAQKELLTAFGFGNLSLTDASQFSIANDNDASAVLIAISSLILSDRSEAEVVEYLAQLISELANKGTFSDATMQQIYKDRNYLNSKLSDIEFNVRNRYSELGYNIEVKDLSYFFDWDENGIVGDELDSGELKISHTSIDVPAEGGNYTIAIQSNKPYYLEIPENLKDGALDTDIPNVVNPDYFQLYEGGYVQKGMLLEKSISNNNITLNVGKSQSRASLQVSMPIFNARGQQVAEINIRQAGQQTTDMEIPNLGTHGLGAFNNILSIYSKAQSALLGRERSFVNSTSFDYPIIMADDNEVGNAWSGLYSAIAQIVSIKSIDNQQYGVYQDFCNTWLAIAYSTLISYWDAVPYYVENLSMEERMRLPRTQKATIIDNLLALTEEPLKNFNEKNIGMTNANDMFFLSKDVVRIVRAKLYMEKGNYSKALPLLETVIGSGRYSLISSEQISYADNSENILSLIDNHGTRASSISYSVFSIFDLKQIYMDAAECAYHVSSGTESKYLNAMNTAKKLSIASVCGLTAVEQMSKLIDAPYKVPCIRRSGKKNSALVIPDNLWYQLAWPIPPSDIYSNPSMTQNPGY